MEATYKIAGMTCDGCVSSVGRALSGALPQTRIEISLDKGQVSIIGDHDAAVVESAIQNAGFDFGGVTGG